MIPDAEGYQYGVRYSDGSVSHRWNGRTQRQRAEEDLLEHRAWVEERRPGPIRPIDQVELVRRLPGGPWEAIPG